MTPLSKREIAVWLREGSSSRLRELYARADSVRERCVGDAVHLRGLIEISSYCERQCMYCGLRKGNSTLTRYRMTGAEIQECVRLACLLGYGTVVLQAGEDDALSANWVAETVRWIKRETALAVTLSLGERLLEELRLWRDAGADRYLLRFETSDRKLYRAIHPQRLANAPNRIELLRELKRLGYEAGGGVMVGIPGQTIMSLAEDIVMFRKLHLDMIGVGPYIPHPAAPLGTGALRPDLRADEQVPASAEMVYKVIALTRILCPDANIPATTALATIEKTHGRMNGLRVGANVVMPNLTPSRYRKLYEIYPDKACVEETALDCNTCLRGQIQSIGRFAARGPGRRGVVEAAEIVSQQSLVQLQA